MALDAPELSTRCRTWQTTRSPETDTAITKLEGRANDPESDREAGDQRTHPGDQVEQIREEAKDLAYGSLRRADDAVERVASGITSGSRTTSKAELGCQLFGGAALI
jgi:hypothetical protein